MLAANQKNDVYVNQCFGLRGGKIVTFLHNDGHKKLSLLMSLTFSLVEQVSDKFQTQ